MKNKHHLIIIDPTAFAGGSKVATENILALLNKDNIRITVLTADNSSWQHANIRRVSLNEPSWLAQQEQGIAYFFRHAFIALMLLITRIRFGHIDIALGASGPGVDLALYLLRPVLKFPVIQLIHGPVAPSRTIARCLKVAHQVHYLQTSAPSLLLALNTLNNAQETLPSHFQLLQNGLSTQHWPTACQQHSASIFWAASLLKWKGLEQLLGALQLMPEERRPTTHICYIKPQGLQLPISEAPIKIPKINWYENPRKLDSIRASANIFVSTSINEPFGLSILEALAAGQAVVIPKDGAYWDQQLQQNVNCIKYQANDEHDLKEALQKLSSDLHLIRQLGTQAKRVAQQYRAEQQYRPVINGIENALLKYPASNRLTGNV